MGKRSLAEELNDLLNPAPHREADPEADAFDAGPRVAGSDDEAPPVEVGRRRLQPDIVLEGPEYAGRPTTFAAAFGDGAVAAGEREWGAASSDDEDDDDDDSGSGSDGGGSSSDGGRPGGARKRARTGGAGLVNGLANGRAAGSDDEGEGGGEDEEDEVERLEREYRAAAAGEGAAAAALRERAARERRKALAVDAQAALWRRALEARILLQRAVAAAPRLPASAAGRAAARAALAGLAADAAGVASDAAELLEELQGRHPGLAEAAAAAGRPPQQQEEDDEAPAGDGGGPGAHAALWARLGAAYAALAPFRDASIDRWHRKTVLAAGGALARGDLRALGAAASAQVAALMADRARAVARARLPRAAARRLCDEEDDAGAGEEDGGDHAADHGEARDPDTYDDAEFYQTLLKEFLEGSGEGSGPGWYSAAPKKRKAVDRRASKGRKLRYHVHEKLVNFMAPEEPVGGAPAHLAALFGGRLFGGGGA